MEDFKVGGQWAILPAMVRYDHKLPPNAKLIYAEIAAKINEEGYCYSHNKHFAQKFNLKDDTVSGLIRKLVDAGYIYIDVNVKRVNQDKRRIYLTSKPYSFELSAGKISDTKKLSGTASEKNPGPIENNIKYNPPPIVPQGGRPQKVKPDWKPERFEAFWKFYPPVNGKRPAKGRAIRAWDKLRPDDETIAQMGKALQRDKNSEMWKKGIGIPYASSWLNSRAWEDEVVPEQGPDTATEPFGGYEAW